MAERSISNKAEKGERAAIIFDFRLLFPPTYPRFHRAEQTADSKGSQRCMHTQIPSFLLLLDTRRAFSFSSLHKPVEEMSCRVGNFWKAALRTEQLLKSYDFAIRLRIEKKERKETKGTRYIITRVSRGTPAPPRVIKDERHGRPSTGRFVSSVVCQEPLPTNLYLPTYPPFSSPLRSF